MHKPPNDIQLTHSPHRPRQSGGDVSNKRPSSKETIDPPPLKSSRETHSTPPTHRTSSNRPPSVISKDSGLMNSFNPSRLSAENAHSGQPSAFTLTTPGKKIFLKSPDLLIYAITSFPLFLTSKNPLLTLF